MVLWVSIKLYVQMEHCLHSMVCLNVASSWISRSILGKLQTRKIMMMGKKMTAKLSSFLLRSPMFCGLLRLMSSSSSMLLKLAHLWCGESSSSAELMEFPWFAVSLCTVSWSGENLMDTLLSLDPFLALALFRSVSETTQFSIRSVE